MSNSKSVRGLLARLTGSKHTNAIGVLSLVLIIRITLHIHLLDHHVGGVNNEVVVGRRLSPA